MQAEAGVCSLADKNSQLPSQLLTDVIYMQAGGVSTSGHDEDISIKTKMLYYKL